MTALPSSGIGLFYAGQITTRAAIRPNIRFVSHLSLIGNFYRESRFRDHSFLFDAAPDFAFNHVRLKPGVIAGRRIYGGQKLYDMVGTSVGTEWSVGKRALVSINASAIHYAYVPERAQQSGWVQTYQLALDRAFSGTFAGRAGITYSRIGAANKGYASRNFSGELALSKDIGPFTLYGRGSITKVRGDENFLFFPVPRNDFLLETNAAAQFHSVRFLGLSPQLKITWIRSNSAVPLYQYRRVRGEIGLTSLF